jgi:antitoxin HicB
VRVAKRAIPFGVARTALVRCCILPAPQPACDRASIAGGGLLATVPELPGCMSDGETEFEAIQNAQDAIQCWLEAAQETNQPIPEPRRRAAGKIEPELRRSPLFVPESGNRVSIGRSFGWRRT